MPLDSPALSLANRAVLQTAASSATPIPSADLPHLEFISNWIHSHMGLNYGERKQDLLYRKLTTLCWRLDISNIGELARQLREPSSTQLVMDLACTVSTNHTFFFREIEVLNQLTEMIAPQLPTQTPWRIWSAAAASGDEAYTVAILLAEQFGMDNARQRIAILGTDISQPMVEKAEHAIYVEQRMELVTPVLRQRYFQPVGLGQWRVIPTLREMCTFRRMNLQTTPWPFQKPFHVILCRNVLYYFDTADQEQLVERMYDATEPGGWLLTSVTETFHNIRTRWKRVNTGIFRKV